MGFSCLYKVCAITLTDVVATSLHSAFQRLELDESEIARHQIAIHDAFENIRSIELRAGFLQQLTQFLDAQAAAQKPVKVTLKILGIFISNILNLLQDKELPERIKGLVLQKMPENTKILEKMYTRDPATLLQNMSGENTFGRYQEACQVLKQRLIKDKDPSGVTFSGRDLKLFAWCREELEATANPLIRVLLEDPKAASHKGDIEPQFTALFDTLNRLIFHIGASDDIADNIQDEFLTRIFADIPFADDIQLASHKSEVAAYRNGIFSEYFEVTVAIWQDGVAQLERLFGQAYFHTEVNPKFLEICQKVATSLTYSQYMNQSPHDPAITQETISDKLAPNIMVECFRYLELKLTQKIAREYDVELPADADLAILDWVIRQSEKNAAFSNMAATAPRELRESDLSSSFPFAMNDKYNRFLEENGLGFVTEFEKFLTESGDTGHFFASYFDDIRLLLPNFDYLNLLLLRREALTQVIERLDRMKRRGIIVPESDYSRDSLAVETLTFVQESVDDGLFMGVLSKRKRHMDLIDRFSEKLMIETGVQEEFFDGWLREIETMRQEARNIQNPALREHTMGYVGSWETFLGMYLMFKRSFDGTI
jgi:hypothetical protein